MSTEKYFDSLIEDALKAGTKLRYGFHCVKCNKFEFHPTFNDVMELSKSPHIDCGGDLEPFAMTTPAEVV